jgi:hypothetical protein
MDMAEYSMTVIKCSMDIAEYSLIVIQYSLDTKEHYSTTGQF